MEAEASVQQYSSAETFSDAKALPAPNQGGVAATIGSPEMPDTSEGRVIEVGCRSTEILEQGVVSIAIGFSEPGESANGPSQLGSGGGTVVIPDVPPVEGGTAIGNASRIGDGQKIDKGSLPIGFERRVRSKLHLKQVAELPCVICSRQPSHAHHVKFAQRRGLSQKVSDEFVVPLCALHHGDLHRASSERNWWEKQGHDPLAIAAELWDRYGRSLN